MHQQQSWHSCAPCATAAALNALKKKKMIETQLEQVENNIQRVNEQQGMLENQRMTVETMGALQYGAHASKQTMSDMKITDVDHVLEEISDQADQMSQIQDAMSQPLGAAADMDMDELEAELEVRCSHCHSLFLSAVGLYLREAGACIVLASKWHVDVAGWCGLLSWVGLAR